MNKLFKGILEYLPKEYNEEQEQEFLNIVILTINKACVNASEYLDQLEQSDELRKKYAFKLNEYKNYVLENSSDVNQILSRLAENRILSSFFEMTKTVITSFFMNKALNGVIDFITELNLYLMSFSEKKIEEAKFEFIFTLGVLEVIGSEEIFFKEKVTFSKLVHDRQDKIVDKASLSESEFGISKETLIKLIKDSTSNSNNLLETYFLSIDQLREIVALLVFYPEELEVYNKESLGESLEKISNIRIATQYYMQSNSMFEFDIQKISFVLKKKDVLMFLKLIDPCTIYNDKKVKEVIDICDLDLKEDKKNNNKIIPFRLFEQAVFYALNQYSKAYKDIKNWNDVFPEMKSIF